MNWVELNNKLKTLDKKDVLIYDDNHKDGNQYKTLTYKGRVLFKVTRPQMNTLKKMGYKIKRREL